MKSMIQQYNELAADFSDMPALPTKMVVCPTCEGKGVHVNRAIDGNGLDPHLADDPDFMRDYMGGVYDVVCEECGGKNVVAVIDESRCSKDQLAAYDEHIAEEYAYQRECEAERRFGC